MICNHTVAKQEDSLITIKELPAIIKYTVKSWNDHAELMSKWEKREPKPVKPLNFLDRRKGYMRLFSYCPDCGEKVNWKKVKEVISTM